MYREHAILIYITGLKVLAAAVPFLGDHILESNRSEDQGERNAQTICQVLFGNGKGREHQHAQQKVWQGNIPYVVCGSPFTNKIHVQQRISLPV